MDIIVNGSHIVGRLYIPIIMIIFLTVMTYFHRHHAIKYLYLGNIFCYLVAIVTYFIIINNAVTKSSSHLMNAIPFIWIIGIFGGYSLSVFSIGVFIIEHSQRHTWAKVIIGIAGAVFVVLCIIEIYLLIQGISSLKSG